MGAPFLSPLWGLHTSDWVVGQKLREDHGPQPLRGPHTAASDMRAPSLVWPPCWVSRSEGLSFINKQANLRHEKPFTPVADVYVCLSP